MALLRELGYPANILTLIRLALLPPILLALGKPERRWVALGCFVLATLTDAIDGPIARWRREVSVLGKVLDPIADKVLLDTLAVVLARTATFPWWGVMALLSRDVGILLASLYLYQRQGLLPSSQTAGKATTVTLSAAICCYLGGRPRLGKALLLLTLTFAAASVVQYGYRFALLLEPVRSSGRVVRQ